MEIPEIYKATFEKAKKSKANAIKSKCLDCCCFQRNEIKYCPVYDCPLWPHRPYKAKTAAKQGTYEDKIENR